MLCDIRFPDAQTKPTHVASIHPDQYYVVLDQVVYVKVGDGNWMQSSYTIRQFDEDVQRGELAVIYNR